MRALACVLASAVFLAPATALGWNEKGHMMVAAIAWKNLEPNVRARATELIKRNPHYEEYLIEGSNKFNRAKIAFIRASVWPDTLRDIAVPADQNPGPDDYVDHGSNPDKSPDADRSIGYDDKFLHRYWHFVDYPYSTDGTKTHEPKKPNALTRIILHRDSLASATASDSVKSYNLVWLLHLVGDVHQPLHAAQRFSSHSPFGDAGGNYVSLCEATFCSAINKKTLHSFWDQAGGRSDNIFFAIEDADELDDPSPLEAAKDDPADWVKESFELATKWVYRPPVLDDNGPFPIGQNSQYKKKAAEIAAERISLAGIRLANLLNAYLK